MTKKPSWSTQNIISILLLLYFFSNLGLLEIKWIIWNQNTKGTMNETKSTIWYTLRSSICIFTQLRIVTTTNVLWNSCVIWAMQIIILRYFSAQIQRAIIRVLLKPLSPLFQVKKNIQIPKRWNRIWIRL